jgi:hypothetical protein
LVEKISLGEDGKKTTKSSNRVQKTTRTWISSHSHLADNEIRELGEKRE